MAGRARRKRRSPRRPDLSQHFIHSATTARRLIATACIRHDALVIEAGPGEGALTKPLAEAAAQVIAVELDRTLYVRLKARLTDTPNVTVRNADFLAYRLPCGQYTFFGNIPFSRTADILRKVAFARNPPEDAYLVVEAVAASRFMGQPFGPESALSLMLKARYEISVLAWLSPQDFSPPPSVNSVLLRLARKQQQPLTTPELRSFDHFAKSVFRSPDGIARNILRRLLTIPQVRSIVTDLNFPVASPPSGIPFEHWLTVFRLMRWNDSGTG